jgi:hypothetical protein
MSNYAERYWEGEPSTGEGITHAAGIDIDLDVVAACGRMCEEKHDFHAPSEQGVTCLRCWYRRLKYPNLVKW